MKQEASKFGQNFLSQTLLEVFVIPDAVEWMISMNKDKVVLCGANAYEKKYYFNKEFDKIPESIKEELHIICVLFTEEVGGIFTICFEEDGTLEIETDAAPEDYLYDEIGSGLLVRKIRDTKQELLQSLSLYYRVLFLHEDVSELLAEE